MTMNKHDGSLELWARDIVDLESLAAKLKQPAVADNLSRYLINHLGMATRIQLSTYSGGANTLVQQYLVDALDQSAERNK